MQADAIIFDKDGTLIDFDAFWVGVSVMAVKDILQELGAEAALLPEILTEFGVQDGITDVDSVLCKGTYGQLGEIVHGVLTRHGYSYPCEQIIEQVVAAYEKNFDAGEVKPTSPKLQETLRKLKRQNKKLAVVTTDNEFVTRKCLRKLGIEELFDKIYTDDGTVPAKPDPYCALDFCRRTGVDKERLVMVGDTLTDARFAKNAGIGMIGIAKTDRGRSLLAPYAAAVVADLSEILHILK